MQKNIPKIPPLSGSEKQQIEQLRSHFNRTVEEMNRALAEKDKEIEKLKKEMREHGEFI